MQLYKIFLFVLLITFTYTHSVQISFAQTTNNVSTTSAKSDLIAQLLIQLQNLQQELANLQKYQTGKPLNTITKITGPKTIQAGEYGTWNFITQNNDPNNASGLMIDWGDGMTSVSGTGHTYSTPGRYTISATHHDGNGEPFTLTYKVKVTSPKTSSALTPWGNKLVTDKSLIPTNKFRAYFFNTKNFTPVINSEIVEQPLLIYPNDLLRGGDYSQFDEYSLGAYWIGSFSYPNDTTVYFDYSDPQWDSVKILVNGKTIVESSLRENATATPRIKLKKGNYIIEVEYRVNWHAGFFRAKIGTVDPAYMDIKTARSAAKAIAGASALTIPIQEYSPSDTITGITFASIPYTSTPKILDLSSYEPTIWDVRDANLKGVKAIIVSSYSGASDIKNAGSIPIFRTRNYEN
ncbi:MAG: PKD domain-containing protein [Patescibacteria group bacterium]